MCSHNNVTLFCDDCLNVLPSLESNIADLFLMDLPYGVLNKSNKKAKWDKPIDINALWIHLKRIGKPNCCFIFFASGIFTHDIVESNREYFKYTLVWDKIRTTGFLNAKKQPLRQHEDIVVFYNRQPTYNPQFTKGTPCHSRGKRLEDTVNNNYGQFNRIYDQKFSDEKYPKSILQFEKNQHHLKHPTEKPVDLLRYLIRTYTNESDLVIDPTMGSGSCGEACLLEKRNFLGIELDKSWFEFSKKRIEQGQLHTTKDGG